jgi:hypothetical protein
MCPPEHGGGDPDKTDADTVTLCYLDTMDQDLDKHKELGLKELDLSSLEFFWNLY